VNKIILLLILVGCKSYHGEMEVVDHLIYKNTRGKTQVLVVGDYQTKIKIKKNKSIIIKAKNYFEDVKFKLKVPKNLHSFVKKSDTGETTTFNFPKNISGQPFSMSGELSQVIKTGDTVTETQVCSNSPRWDIDCNWYNGNFGFGNGYGPNTSCQGIPTGTREITYRLDEVTSTLFLQLANNEGQPNATINAESVEVEKVVLETSDCTQ